MRRVIRRKVRTSRDGVNLVGDVTAVVASQTRRQGEHSATSSRQQVRVVQRNGRTRTEIRDTETE